MQLRAHVPLDMVRVVNGTIVLAMAIPELIRIFPLVQSSIRKGISSLGLRRGAGPGRAPIDPSSAARSGGALEGEEGSDT